ncbi:MAG: cell wall hydrolase [Eubacteriales bacterium]
MKCMISECTKQLKIGVLAEALAFLLTASSLTAPVQGASAPPASEQEEVRLYVNGVGYPGHAVLYKDTTYVELGEFTDEVRLCDETWDSAALCARFSGEDIEMSVTDGAAYMIANNRYLWCENGVFADGERTYVPLRAAAKALGADVAWNADEFAAYVTTGDTPILPGDQYYNADEVYWLSRIIYSEAGIEPFRGQIAVGNVVMNRVRSAQFPDSIYGVIFDSKYGVQFSPTANGTIYCTPSEEAVIAAKICLEGYSVSDIILYFLNASLASNFWIPQNRDYVMTISGHDFYS